MNINKFDFEKFSNECKKIAKKLNTIVEIKPYLDYGWVSVCYMTDKFGGTYANIHVDLHTGEMVLDFNEANAFKIKNMDVLEAIVFIKMNDMLKNRDMNTISELINDEY